MLIKTADTYEIKAGRSLFFIYNGERFFTHPLFLHRRSRAYKVPIAGR